MLNPLIPENDSEFEEQCIVVRWARFQAKYCEAI